MLPWKRITFSGVLLHYPSIIGQSSYYVSSHNNDWNNQMQRRQEESSWKHTNCLLCTLPYIHVPQILRHNIKWITFRIQTKISKLAGCCELGYGLEPETLQLNLIKINGIWGCGKCFIHYTVPTKGLYIAPFKHSKCSKSLQSRCILALHLLLSLFSYEEWNEEPLLCLFVLHRIWNANTRRATSSPFLM